MLGNVRRERVDRRRRVAELRPGASGRRPGDTGGPGQRQAARYAERSPRARPRRGRGHGTRVGQGSAPAEWRGPTQSHCRSRPAGEYRRMMRRLIPILLLAGLSGCGLQPLYRGGSSGPIAATLRSVTVGPIAGQSGWLVRNKLVDRLGESGSGPADYRLDVTLDDNITALGIRGDRAATYERRTPPAPHHPASAARGSAVPAAEAGADTRTDRPGSE